MGRFKYSLPLFLEGIVTQHVYCRWISRESLAAYQDDCFRKRPFVKDHFREDYGRMINDAVVAGNGVDPFTGNKLRFDLVDTYDYNKARGNIAYEKSFDLMPSVDHIDPRSDTLALEICSKRTNICKNRQDPAEFIALCRKIADHYGRTPEGNDGKKISTGRAGAAFSNPPLYFPPAFLEGICTAPAYRRWLDRRAGKLFSADKKLKRPYAVAGGPSLYKQKIDEAARKGRFDPFTGDALRWDRIGLWDPDGENPDMRSREKFKLMPTVDHVDPASDILEFEICSWLVNDSKGILNPGEFVGFCKMVADHDLKLKK